MCRPDAGALGGRRREARRLCGLVLSILFFVGLSSAAKAAEEFAVIVHAENPYDAPETEARALVRQLLLKRRSTWPSGLDVRPIAPRRDGEIHPVVREHVLSMTEAELDAYWISTKSRTGATPPRTLRSVRTVARAIGKFRGGLGVVPATVAKRAPGVRILFTIP